MSGNSSARRWRVRIHRWDVYELRNVVPASREEAEERALECEAMSNPDRVDGGLQLVDAVEEEGE